MSTPESQAPLTCYDCYRSGHLDGVDVSMFPVESPVDGARVELSLCHDCWYRRAYGDFPVRPPASAIPTEWGRKVLAILWEYSVTHRVEMRVVDTDDAGDRRAS